MAARPPYVIFCRFFLSTFSLLCTPVLSRKKFFAPENGGEVEWELPPTLPPVSTALLLQNRNHVTLSNSLVRIPFEETLMINLKYYRLFNYLKLMANFLAYCRTKLYKCMSLYILVFSP